MALAMCVYIYIYTICTCINSILPVYYTFIYIYIQHISHLSIESGRLGDEAFKFLEHCVL